MSPAIYLPPTHKPQYLGCLHFSGSLNLVVRSTAQTSPDGLIQQYRRMTLLQDINAKAVTQHKTDMQWCSDHSAMTQLRHTNTTEERRKHPANGLPRDAVMAERKQEEQGQKV